MLDDLQKFINPELYQEVETSDEINQIAVGISKLMEDENWKYLERYVENLHDSLIFDPSRYAEDGGQILAAKHTGARAVLQGLKAWFEQQKQIVKNIAERKNASHDQ